MSSLDPTGVLAGADVGGKVELGPWELLAKIGVSLENLNKREADREARRAQAMSEMPGDPLLSGSGVYPASGNLIFDAVGSQPTSGRLWQIRHIMVGGVQADDSPAGKVYVYRSGGPPNDLSLINLMDVATLPMPQPAFYSTHQFLVRPGERVWCVVTGGTSGTQYVAAVQVEDWEERVYRLGYQL